jgi:putative ABC transport system ATP-binding protein
MEPVIQVHDLVKVYSLGEVEVHALQGISLSIERGEFVAIMGPSGSGKTTLLNVIGCIDKPTKGKVLLDGVDATALPENQLYKIRRDKMGFIFQTFNLLPYLNARENV